MLMLLCDIDRVLVNDHAFTQLFITAAMFSSNSATVTQRLIVGIIIVEVGLAYIMKSADALEGENKLWDRTMSSEKEQLLFRMRGFEYFNGCR